MQNGVFQFADPSKFGDWATYAGFDRRTGDVGVAPVSPPSMEDIQNKISDTSSQLGQGNFAQAAKTFLGIKPPTSPEVKTTTPPTTTVGPYNYEEDESWFK